MARGADEIHAALAVWRAAPGAGTSDAAALAREIRALGHKELELTPLRMAVFRTATLEPLSDTLVVDAAAHSIWVDAAFGGYERIEAQLLGGPQTIDADAVLLAPDMADLSTIGAYDPLGNREWPQLAADELVRLASLARSRTRGHVLALVHGSLQPTLDGLGDQLQPDRGGDRMARFRAVAFEGLASVPGCHALDADLVVRRVGLARALDPRMWQVGRMPWSADGFRALAVLISRALGALTQPRRKCLVLDCDNTLWGGVLGDVGREGIELAPEGKGAGFHALQRDALALARRGIALALLSKNDDAAVLDVLDRHPHMLLRRNVIAARSIGWGDKAAGLRSIAAQLNIGLDALVFVDDSPVECGLIRSELPQVAVYRTPPESWRLPGFLLDLREFDVLKTLETDHARSASFQVRAQREEALVAHSTQTDMEGYLRSLKIRVVCEQARGTALERVAQMEGKTNQFNARTPRFDMTTLDDIIRGGGEVFAMRVADRFGDYGLTVACAIRVDDRGVEVASFLMSCRIIGLGAETAMLARVCQWAAARGHARILGDIIFTERNTPVRDMYQRAGFRKTGEHADGTQWEFALAQSPPSWPTWITEEASS